MMTLLREALSWNYVLVTAVISSLLAQFTKVILNLIILGSSLYAATNSFCTSIYA